MGNKRTEFAIIIDERNPKPLYLQLKDNLLNEIVKHKLTRGTSIPPASRLAEKCGLSIITVERALKELVKEGHLYRRPKRGTFVNDIKTKQSGNIGIIIYDRTFISHPFTSEILRGIEDVHSILGDNLVLYAIKEFKDPLKNLFFEEIFTSRHIKGVILFAQQIEENEILILKEKNMPFVLVNNYISNIELPFVYFDYVQGMKQSVEYLISLGHRKIAFLGGDKKFVITKDMIKGYRLALSKHGVGYNSSIILCDGAVNYENGKKLINKLIDSRQEFTAVVTADDFMARSVIEELEKRGFQVPESVSVVGFNDMPVASSSRPSITTIKISGYKLGKLAMGLLDNLVSKKKNKQSQIVLKPTLIIRESTFDYNKRL